MRYGQSRRRKATVVRGIDRVLHALLRIWHGLRLCLRHAGGEDVKLLQNRAARRFQELAGGGPAALSVMMS
jgi:hypothetical protein